MQELTAAVTALHTDLNDLRYDLNSVTLYGTRSRRLIRAAAISIVLDVVLSLGLGWISFQAREASHNAATAIKTNCVSSNEARKTQIDLWTAVFALPSTKPPTEQAARDYDWLKAHISVIFAPRDCDALVKGLIK